MNNNFSLPVLSTNATSCLTMQDITETGVQVISLSLESLLIKPGFDFLNSLDSINSYIGWVGSIRPLRKLADESVLRGEAARRTGVYRSVHEDSSTASTKQDASSVEFPKRSIVINASELKMDATGEKYLVYSELDGSKFTFSKEDILALLVKLSPQMVILPKSFFVEMENILPLTIKAYFASDDEHLDNMREIDGVYLAYDISEENQLQKFCEQFADTPKYIFGELNFAEISFLLEKNDVYFESVKPSLDAYQGMVYTNNNIQSILDNKFQFNMEVLDKKCKCSTCTANYTAAYLHHLYQHTPLLCQRLLISHNVFYAGHLRRA